MTEEKQIINCPQCSGKLRVPVADRLLNVKCPHCGHAFEHGIPDAEVLESTPPIPAAPVAPSPPSKPAAASESDFLEGHTAWVSVVAVILGVAVAVWLGGAPFGIWPEIESFWTWLPKTLIATVITVPVMAIAAFIVGFVLSILLAILPGDRSMALGYALAFCLGGAICIALPTAYTWAWLGHDTDWREKPYQWAASEFPVLNHFMLEIVGEKAPHAAGKASMASAKTAQQRKQESSHRDICERQMINACDQFKRCNDVESCNKRAAEMTEATRCAAELGWKGDWNANPDRGYSFNFGKVKHVCNSPDKVTEYERWKKVKDPSPRDICEQQMINACNQFKRCYDVESCNQRAGEMTEATRCAAELGWKGDWSASADRSYSFNFGEVKHVCYSPDQATNYLRQVENERENEKLKKCETQEKKVRQRHFCCLTSNRYAIHGKLEDEYCRTESGWQKFEKKCYKLDRGFKMYQCG